MSNVPGTKVLDVNTDTRMVEMLILHGAYVRVGTVTNCVGKQVLIAITKT